MSNFNFKKKYGQNFLQDKNIINNIISSISVKEDDLVIEIGPGGGALTKYIKDKGCKYIGYEIDLEVKQYLSQFEDDSFIFIYDDFLNRDLIKDIESLNFKYERLYIVGNLPYYITTPIILKIIESKISVDQMLFMVQKEVAERFAAKPGGREYGSISVLLNFYYDVVKLFNVSKTCFNPVPNVDSAVVKFSSKENLCDIDIDKFTRLVRDAFQFKRKNLRNNLKGYNLKLIESTLNRYGYSLNDRAEKLSYEIFVILTLIL